jgi:hypothetical protein
MHHFSLTCILEIGTVGIILFQKSEPNFMICGAIRRLNRSNVVQIPERSIETRKNGGEKPKKVTLSGIHHLSGNHKRTLKNL